jgi:hypothetical protein
MPGAAPGEPLATAGPVAQRLGHSLAGRPAGRRPCGVCGLFQLLAVTRGAHAGILTLLLSAALRCPAFLRTSCALQPWMPQPKRFAC